MYIEVEKLTSHHVSFLQSFGKFTRSLIEISPQPTKTCTLTSCQGNDISLMSSIEKGITNLESLFSKIIHCVQEGTSVWCT